MGSAVAEAPLNHSLSPSSDFHCEHKSHTASLQMIRGTDRESDRGGKRATRTTEKDSPNKPKDTFALSVMNTGLLGIVLLERARF